MNRREKRKEEMKQCEAKAKKAVVVCSVICIGFMYLVYRVTHLEIGWIGIIISAVAIVIVNLFLVGNILPNYYEKIADNVEMESNIRFEPIRIKKNEDGFFYAGNKIFVANSVIKCDQEGRYLIKEPVCLDEKKGYMLLIPQYNGGYPVRTRMEIIKIDGVTQEKIKSFLVKIEKYGNNQILVIPCDGRKVLFKDVNGKHVIYLDVESGDIVVERRNPQLDKEIIDALNTKAKTIEEMIVEGEVDFCRYCGAPLKGSVCEYCKREYS